MESGMWIHVTASNSGAVEAEWNPTPVAAGVTADYARSTHLPGDIDPGATVSGWIYIPVQTRPGGQPVAVRFRDVAVDNYRTVGDVVLQFSV